MENDSTSSAPIAPGGPTHDLSAHAQQLLGDVSRLPAVARFALAALFGLLSWACFSGAAGLAEYKHWVPWAVILLLLEPMALAMSFGVVFFVAPQSRFARWFTTALLRAGAGVALIMFVLACAAATIIVAGLWELYRLSR